MRLWRSANNPVIAKAAEPIMTLERFRDLAAILFYNRSRVFGPCEYLDKSVIAQWASMAYEAAIEAKGKWNKGLVVDTIEALVSFDEKKRWGRFANKQYREHWAYFDQTL